MTTENLLRIGLLDNRNIDLYNQLLQTQQITTILEYRSDYLLYAINKTAKIFVPRDNLNAASYTHELLHVFLRSKEIFIGGGIIRHIESKPKLNYIFSKELKDRSY